MTDQELELKPAETHKDFWIGVSYKVYNGGKPYASMLWEKREDATGEVIYKISIPYKKEKDE